MTIGQALNNFFNSFGITAYANTSVPDNAQLPYMTYTTTLGDYGDVVSLTVQLWHKTTSEAIPNAKADEIKDAIGLGGKLLPYDNGAIWLKRGMPFCISQTAASDKTVKLRQINITLEFI